MNGPWDQGTAPPLRWASVDEERDPGARYTIWLAYTERRERQSAERERKGAT